MTTKEFLHHVVRDREASRTRGSTGTSFRNPWTVPQTSENTARNVGGVLVTDTVVMASQPQHMEMPPWVRTAYAQVLADDRNPSPFPRAVLLRADSTPEVARQMFARTDVRVGNVEREHYNMAFANTFMRHGLTLISQHGCFPDYNISSIVSAGTGDDTRYRAVTYRCAWCNAGFTLGE